ncbi:MAG: ABC-F family ATP-binding cassette domain-containing protein [Parvularculaceae bacterium]|nr:ABC-F family ATP-binding cassette domain-containing protein [Parvularculaceae bacterium]
MLHITDLTYRIEGKPLFEKATAAISDKWKVGFVGRNGAGKSTLLRLIKGEIAPDEGEIAFQSRRRLGGVEQEAPASNSTLLDIVLEFDSERSALLKELESAPDPLRLAEIHARLNDIDAHSAEARAASILFGLGFSSTDQKRAAKDFSGGWRMRVALAGVLFSAPDLLLLDEPTNYLDIEGAMWLETFIRRYPYAAIIVSHDRDFLNRTATHILALENRKLDVSAGDYDSYEEKRAQARANALAFRTKQEAQRRHMQAFIDRFRAKASKAKQAQSRIKALEKMQLVAEPVEERVAGFRFNNPRKMAPPIIRLADACLGYEEARPILRKVNLRIDQDDRIAILGPNGEGKTTLVKSLAGRLSLLSGDIFKNKKLNVAYFSQHQLDELTPSESAYDHVRALAPDATEAQVRAIAASFGFGADKADTKVENLSGGEKARLLLGLITYSGPHLIILDEPTNHLDIEARASLSQALNEYSGAVIMITHDAHLASAVADRLWLVKDGAVAPFEGDLEDYRALILNAQRTQGENSARKSADPKTAQRQTAAARREATAPLRRKVEAAESRLEELGAILPRLDAALADAGLYENNVARATKLQKERAALIAAIAAAEDRLLAAMEKLEQANKDAGA